MIITDCVHDHTGQVQYGFGEIDYTGPEPNGVTIQVVKRMPNVADFYINVTPLTYSQLNSTGVPLPIEIDQNSLPDAAECEF